MKIFLDDQAAPGDIRASWVPEGWVVVTTPEEFKETIETALAEGTTIEAIDFDNDLGHDIEGVHLVHWLKEQHPEIVEANPAIEFTVHSQNSVAAEVLRAELGRLKTHYRELIEAKDLPHPFGEISFR
jgi:hypothetical protein